MNRRDPYRLIAVTDSRKGLLFRARASSDGSVRLEVLGSLDVPAPDREHHRPTLLGGTERRGSVARSGASAAQHNGGFGHDEEEDLRRAAASLAQWLEHSAKEISATEIAVFAPHKLLPNLRDRLSRGSLSPELRAAELAGLTVDQLSQHPLVVEAASTSGARPAEL